MSFATIAAFRWVGTRTFMSLKATLSANCFFSLAFVFRMTKLSASVALVRSVNEGLYSDFYVCNCQKFRGSGHSKSEEVSVGELWRFTPSFLDSVHLGHPLTFKFFLKIFNCVIPQVIAMDDTFAGVE